MSNCVRISHPDVAALSKQLKLPRIIIAAKIGVWQEANKNLDRFPTLEELKQDLKPERILGIKVRPSLEVAPDVLAEASNKIEALRKMSEETEMEDWSRQHVLEILGIGGEDKNTKNVPYSLLQNASKKDRKLLELVIKHIGDKAMDLPLDANGVRKTIDNASAFEFFTALRGQKIDQIIVDPYNPDSTINPETLEVEYMPSRKEEYFGLSKDKWFDQVKISSPDIYQSLLKDDKARTRSYNQYLLDMQDVKSFLDNFPNYMSFLDAKLSTGVNVKSDLKTMARTLGNMNSKVAAEFIGNEVRELIFADFLTQEVKKESLNPQEDAWKAFSFYMARTVGPDAYKEGTQFNYKSKVNTLASKDVKNPHAQLAYDLVLDKDFKAKKDTNMALNELKVLQMAMKKEGSFAEDCIEFGTNSKVMIWKSAAKQAKLTATQREYIKTCKRIFSEFGYDSDVIPQKHMGFWDTFFSKGFWKRLVAKKGGNLNLARKNALYNRSPYDNFVVIDDNGVKLTVKEHREKIITEYHKGAAYGAVTLKQAKKQIENILKKADGLIIDDDNNVVYKMSQYDISTQFGQVFDINSITDLNAVINNFLKAQIFKFHVDPLLPILDVLRDRMNSTEKNFNKGKENYITQWFDKHMDSMLKRNTKDTSVSNITKTLINGLIAWTAYRSLGINIYAMAGNLVAGYSNNLSQIGAGIVIRGHKRLIQDPIKFAAILEELGIISTIVDESYNLTSKAVGNVNKVAFATSEKPEWLMQGVAAIGMMSNEQWDAYWSKNELKVAKILYPNSASIQMAKVGDIKTDENGNLNTNALTDDQTSRMLHIIQRIHGAYHSLMKRNANRNIVARPFMMFKTWMFETYLMFFGNYDKEGVIRNGVRLKSFKNTAQTLLQDKQTTAEMVKGIIFMQKTISDLQDKDELSWTRADKENVKKIRNYLLLMGGALGLLLASDDDDDKNKKSAFHKLLVSTLTFGVNVSEKAVTVISPVLPLIWDILKTTKDLITGERYEKGPHKDQRKGLRELYDITPLKSIVNIIDPKEEEAKGKKGKFKN